MIRRYQSVHMKDLRFNGRFFEGLRKALFADTVNSDLLVCPFRIDISIREEFLRFTETHLDLYHNDFRTFLSIALKEPFFDFFCHIFSAHVRYLRQGLSDFKEMYALRLRSFLELFFSIRRDGFDLGRPILLRVAVLLHQYDQETLVQRPFYLDMGSHRLAILRYLNRNSNLPKKYFRVIFTFLWRPRNNTATLRQHQAITEEYYQRWLSSFKEAS